MTHVLLSDPLNVGEGGFNHQAGLFSYGLSTNSGLAEATDDLMPFVILSLFFGLTVSHLVMSHQEL